MISFHKKNFIKDFIAFLKRYVIDMLKTRGKVSACLTIHLLKYFNA